MNKEEKDLINKIRKKFGMVPFEKEKSYKDYLEDAKHREKDPIYHVKRKKSEEPIYKSFEKLKIEEDE